MGSWHDFGKWRFGELFEAERPVAIGIEPQEQGFLGVFIQRGDSSGVAEFLERQGAGIIGIQMIEYSAVCVRVRPAWGAKHGWQLGAVFRGDLAVAIGVETMKQCLDAFIRNVGEHFRGAEFLEADSAAAIGIELHEAAHSATVMVPASIAPLADFPEFFAADHAIAVFIEPIEEAEPLFFGQTGDPSHCCELLE